ncbi:MAG: hypothetical protein RIT41_1743, partial [Bacteroidota bacterium]
MPICHYCTRISSCHVYSFLVNNNLIKMKTKSLSFFSFLLLLIITTQLFAQKNISTQPTQLITNVQLIDGTGKPAYSASVRIQGKKIIQVGQLKAGTNEQVIDGKGLVLAPGFIDSHSHHFGDLDD